jgi:hypothetical protein
MKRRILAFVSSVAMIMMAGCATVPSEPMQQQRTSTVLSAPKDKVWPVLVAEVAQSYPVQAIEKDSGLLTTQLVQMPVGFNNAGMENYIFPPGGFLATWGGLRMSMQIVVIESDPGKTTVTISTHYEAFESNVSKSWLVARSNGSVENQILSNIEQKLASK